MVEPAIAARLRSLPSVEEVVGGDDVGPHALAVAAAREVIAGLRERILDGESIDAGVEAIREEVRVRVAAARRPSLRRVLNATGVVLHTNLGRAPLAPEAASAVAAAAAGYSNLELDLESGARGSRHDHVEPLLRDLTGAEAAIAVNNNAAAVLLALAALAAGREVITSRGELVEIGGSFRIPEILAQSGARLVEVGTTNRTRLGDYEAAIGPDTAAILRVHQSNFRTVGFTERAATAELAALAFERGLALIDDLGSGALEPLADEPPLRGSVAAGATLVCASADKLLGGPQAGIIAGRGAAVAACRSHPLARALRLDKLQLAALAATLRLHRDGGAVPALEMLAAEETALGARAAKIASAIGPGASVARGTSRPGGGTLPLTELEGPVCEVDPGPGGADALAARLRRASPPVVGRIAAGKVILDPRCLSDEEAELCGAAVREALGRE
jgi:L-seryl-tRNA(Ser) seleniumtransferase